LRFPSLGFDKRNNVNEKLYFINGDYTDPDNVAIHGGDRGFNFGDGIYEVIRYYNGVGYTLTEHLERLQRSAELIEVDLAYSIAEYKEICDALVARSGLKECMIYGQVTRGVQVRDHMYPDDIKPTDYWFVRPLNTEKIRASVEKGYKLVSCEDKRWDMCNIKSISLLPNIMAKNKARKAGAQEAIFYHGPDKLVTEGGASNIYAVKDSVIYSAPDGPKILPGITRIVIYRLAKQLGIEVREESKPLDFFMEADEVVASSTTMEVMPIRQIDDQPLKQANAKGHGPVFGRIYNAFLEDVASACGTPTPAEEITAS
jgi:D-alanine transaminase